MVNSQRSMVNLVIDIGNTLQKLAVFDESGKIVKFLQEKQLSVPILEEVLACYPVRSAIVSSVGKDDEELFRWLGCRVKLVRFSSECRLPINMRYATPETLGTDRIANVVGANAAVAAPAIELNRKLRLFIIYKFIVPSHPPPRGGRGLFCC